MVRAGRAHRLTASIVCCVALVGTALTLAACGAIVGVPEGSPQPFDAAVWRAQPETDARFHMIDDLLDQHALVGMSLDDVEELLGPPARIGDILLDGSSWHVYYVGTTTYWDILGSEEIAATLNLEDDGHGRVKRYRLYPRDAFPNHPWTHDR
jgi:hypothetical protein